MYPFALRDSVQSPLDGGRVAEGRVREPGQAPCISIAPRNSLTGQH